jgi:hypothetical protein
MRVGTRRAIRARYPNGDPERGTGYSLEHLDNFIPRKSQDRTPIQNYFSNPEDWPGVYWLKEPEGGSLPGAGENIAGTGHWYDSYGGGCSGRQAPFGYWCSVNNSRSECPDDGWLTKKYSMPGGFAFDPTTDNAPARIANWSKPSGVVYHISAGFESVQCLVSHVANNTVYFDEAVGCDQGPQAWDTGLLGWYADNVKEECDSPGEYYLDSDEKALYYTFNATEQPTGDEDFSLTTTKVIFNVSGTQARSVLLLHPHSSTTHHALSHHNHPLPRPLSPTHAHSHPPHPSPVKGVTIRGLTIRDAALTFLGTTRADIHIMPSDSDWTIQRSGAVLAEGTEGFTFEGNEVTRCDGNGG